MATNTNEVARIVARIEQWAELAAEWLYDIEGFRSNPGNENHRWPSIHDPYYAGLSALTDGLVHELTIRCPGMEMKPLLDVYRAVELWRTTKTDVGLPTTPELFALMDVAMMQLRALRVKIEGAVSLTASIPGVSFNDSEQAILQALADKPAHRHTIEEIAHGTRRGTKLVGEILAKFRTAGLACRPAGDRGGNQITPEGLELWATLYPPTKTAPQQ